MISIRPIKFLTALILIVIIAIISSSILPMVGMAPPAVIGHIAQLCVVVWWLASYAELVGKGEKPI